MLKDKERFKVGEYLLDRHMVNLPHGPLGGVRVDNGLVAGSLILTPRAFLPTTFLSFFGGGAAAATFRLPA
jgi:hypothetical protein